ncbi:flagellar basal body P-ring formation protein FlgA [Paracoccus aurantiacus]|uniref:Flagella basal body P-ring formation protein FlgA n=1 Tax=Paracoccus aurantiacus TaxID=2599412 RepID=A0A5C6S662_9RHOB|nr:flagellar basal body P-ring formation chaperone FlgA [Paracoccus aurantiacus]TXB69797.1 flagellar basal body P-ring formation protein FlgA [Paracoccus aurantiacus]
MRGLIALVLALSALPLHGAAAVVATRNLPAGTVIAPDDLTWAEDVPGGITEPELAIGMQTRMAIYAGRAVVPGALREPVLISRNQIVRVAFDTGPLRIEAEGRTLSEGAAGDIVRVMNLSSRSTISALVLNDGSLVATSSKSEQK